MNLLRRFRRWLTLSTPRVLMHNTRIWPLVFAASVTLIAACPRDRPIDEELEDAGASSDAGAPGDAGLPGDAGICSGASNGEGCGDNGLICQDGQCMCPGQPPESHCGDGADNDCDGFLDCADPACDGLACDANGQTCSASKCSCPGGTIESACGDGVDNDCDGLTDCADPNCGGIDICPCQPTETDCADNRDNDCDGLIDCSDSNCQAKTCDGHGRTCGRGQCQCARYYAYAHWEYDPPSERYCKNGVDDDCDGLTDCADPDCQGRGPELACTDGRDDDCDGATDCADSDCAGTCPCGGTRATVEHCDDREDDDCDGLVDCADPDCNGKTCALFWCTYGQISCSQSQCQCRP